MMFVRSFCLICICALVGVTASESNDSKWPDLPAVLLKDAQAAMLINRGHHLLDQFEDSATEASVSISPFLRLIAQHIYRAQDLSGIDRARPALLLWRKGRAPLIGIIPIKDRDAFMQGFGRVLVGNSMMIRVGENQGTTVYKQNTDQGMIEYRLLIRDSTAYLGRSAAECSLLSEIKLEEETSSPAFRMYIDKPFEFLPHLRDYFSPSKSALEAELKSLVSSEYDLLLQQVKSVTLTLDVDVKRRLQVELKIQPQKESVLELWVTRQQNQSSRLLPMMNFENASVSLYGNISWAGGLKENGNRVSKIIERSAKTDSPKALIAKSLASWAALLDRQSSFAHTLHFKALEVGKLDVFGVGVTEQARAVELLSYQQVLERYLQSEVLKEEGVRVGDLVSVGGQQSYWKTAPGLLEADVWNELNLAAESHIIQSWGGPDKAILQERALNIVERLDQSVSPIGEAGVVVVNIKLHNLLREISNLSGSIGYKINDAEINGSLSLDNDRNLVLAVNFKLPEVAQAIRSSDWTAALLKLEQLFLGKDPEE